LLLDEEALQLRKDVKITMVMVYSLLGLALTYPFALPASEQHHANVREYAHMLSELLRDKKLRIPPINVLPNGLAGVSDGIRELVAGKVRAQKLVYRIQDTP